MPYRNSVIQTGIVCDLLTLCYPASDRLGSHSLRTAGAARGVWYCRRAAAKWCTPSDTRMTGPIKNKTYLKPKDAAQDFDHLAPCTFLLHWNRVTSAKVWGPCPIAPTRLTAFDSGPVATSATMIKTRDMNLATEREIPGDFLLRLFLFLSETE